MLAFLLSSNCASHINGIYSPSEQTSVCLIISLQLDVQVVLNIAIINGAASFLFTYLQDKTSR